MVAGYQSQHVENIEMAFVDTIRSLTYAPRTPNASGFLPPLLRAMGHIMFLDACLADPDVTVTEENALEELRHAETHWNARATTTAISTATANKSAAIGIAITEAIAEYPGWDENTRIGNLRDLTHRIVQYAADCDRELVGLRDSDAGTTL
jgi:hypothetical protein